MKIVNYVFFFSENDYTVVVCSNGIKFKTDVSVFQGELYVSQGIEHFESPKIFEGGRFWVRTTHWNRVVSDKEWEDNTILINILSVLVVLIEPLCLMKLAVCDLAKRLPSVLFSNSIISFWLLNNDSAKNFAPAFCI